ncbi:MAG: outer membrane protein assembly factor BamE [Planctomycetes bacterium]|nr:outer membrane protein assembly factor BamE [Planctomycetota bacterium]
MRTTALAPLLLLPLVQGCLLTRDTVNQPLDEARVVKLARQMSSSDVLELLGGPMEVVQLGRRSAWRYDHQNTKRTGLTLVVATALNTDTQEDRLWLFFDEHDRLAAFGSTLQASSSEWALPWVDSHE